MQGETHLKLTLFTIKTLKTVGFGTVVSSLIISTEKNLEKE